jgi:predicted protein tyrosine phosphatase
VTAELGEWAELIFVMEEAHRAKFSLRFKKQLKNRRVICPNIPDTYDFMDPALVEILNVKVRPYLPAPPRSA